MVTLADLAREHGGDLRGAAEHAAARIDVRDVVIDSREAREGALFCALSGGTRDGASFVGDALQRGAVAVLAPSALETSAPLWIHERARRVAGLAASSVHGHPSRGLFVAAITGTNGKTTTAHLTAQLLAHAGRRPGVLGTTGNRLADGRLLPATHTTADAPTLHRILARHRELGGDSIALEASSHALAQERLAGLEVSVAVFTNLTRDHLDYHGDMPSYAQAKSELFAALRPGACAVVNADDPASELMAQRARKCGASVYTFSTKSRADLRASSIEVAPDGVRFQVEGMGISQRWASSRLLGRFNVENALAALAAVLVSGASPLHALEGLASVLPAPGRMQAVAAPGRGFAVVVDYAHTEDALRKALATLRETVRPGARLVVVFGCGGDRDRGKRPLMGRAASELGDVVVVTSDNPRSEEPLAIVDEILVGARGARAELHVEPERRAAIALALSLAREGDVVLIAGKGHETTQTTGERAAPFDDREVAAELLRGAGAGVRP
jgi:UDP-N-acetylmuramoyl-L-alanyl-D-glutamate--2,6-diaminopimelate ligase